MNFFIREGTTKDAELIADMSRQTFYETFAPDNTKEDMELFLSEQFTRDKLIQEVGKKGHEFYLAYYDEKVAGYIKLREGHLPSLLNATKALEIARLYCLQEFIGKGIGRQLMQKSIERAKERGMDVLWLGVWEKNQRAIDFYKAFGFEKFNETRFLLGKDVQTDWLMKKKL